MTDDQNEHDENDAFEALSAADEIEVSALLAQLPDPVLPDDVEARIAAALADDPATAVPPSFPHAMTVLPTHDATPTTGRRSRRPRVLQGAAALLAVALIGAAVVGITHATSGSDGTRTTAGVAAATPITASGRDYTAGTLAVDVQQLLAPSASTAPSPASEAGPGSGAGTTSAGTTATKGATTSSAGAGVLAATDGGGTTSASQTVKPVKPAKAKTPSAAELAAVSALVRTTATRDACVATLAGAPGVTPIAIDIGSFDGRAAAVIVLPHTADPTEVEVWVVGSTCSDKDAPFPFQYAQVKRP